jgi:hypothetical protein
MRSWHDPSLTNLRFLLLALICTWPVAGLQGTTEIALRSRYRVVLAVDSRAIYGTNGSATECKLFEANQVYAAVSGLAHYGTSYRAVDAMRDGFARPGSFQQHVSAAALSLQRRVKVLLAALAANNESAYRYLTQPSSGASDLVQLAVAQVVNRQPMLGIIELRQESGGNGLRATTTVCPGNCDPNHAIFYLGYWERIKPYVSGSGQPRNVASAASLDRLIRLEMQAHPREVGAPINVLELTNYGARWLQNGGNCSLPGVAW